MAIIVWERRLSAQMAEDDVHTKVVVLGILTSR